MGVLDAAEERELVIRPQVQFERPDSREGVRRHASEYFPSGSRHDCQLPSSSARIRSPVGTNCANDGAATLIQQATEMPEMIRQARAPMGIDLNLRHGEAARQWPSSVRSDRMR